MSARSHVLFLAAVFFLFVPAGLLTDIPQLGANGTVRLLASSLVSGALAVAYVVVLREWPSRLPFLIAAHVAVIVWFDRIFGAPGVALLGAALHTRLVIDVNIATTSITAGFLLFSHVIRIEGTRYGRVHAEIALARDIHRLLVPAVDQRIGRFEFRGISAASGDVGGDLIDLVETPAGWTSFVAEHMGHGVAAGLMMGMVKSTARAALREGASLDRVLATLNTVLFDLKSSWMYATFAGLQWQNGNLRFMLAGHLPDPALPCANVGDRRAVAAAAAGGDVRRRDFLEPNCRVRRRRRHNHPD